MNGSRTKGFLLAAALCFATAAVAGDKEETTAVAIADYLVAGRAVVARNQSLINDPAKGDKGFTADVYEQQVRPEFLKRSGVDFTKLAASDDFGKAILAVHAASREVVSEAQAQINEAGKAFKGFNPAVFGARVGKKVREKTGIVVKQTSLKFRGDYNRPDDFESAVLKKFEGGKPDQTHFEEAAVDGRKAARYMLPVYVEKSCLACHGDPAGEVDVSGRAKEGYREGELRGAISVVVPVR